MQNASVVVADLLATNGVLHVLSQVWLEGGVRTGKLLVRPGGRDVLSGPRAPCQVLLPPRGAVPAGQGLLQQLDSVPAFHLFRELLQVRAGGGGRPVRGAFPLAVSWLLAPRVRTEGERATPDTCPLPLAPQAGSPD